MRLFSEGWKGGITGPNAALTCEIEDEVMDKFIIIKRPYDDKYNTDANQLMALIPISDGRAKAEDFARILVKQLNAAVRNGLL